MYTFIRWGCNTDNKRIMKNESLWKCREHFLLNIEKKATLISKKIMQNGLIILAYPKTSKKVLLVRPIRPQHSIKKENRDSPSNNDHHSDVRKLHNSHNRSSSLSQPLFSIMPWFLLPAHLNVTSLMSRVQPAPGDARHDVKNDVGRHSIMQKRL